MSEWLAPGGFLSMTNAAARKVRSPRVVNVQDFRSLARRRLPKVVFDYLDGGAEDEITLRENRRAFEDVTFRPCHAVAFAQCDLSTRVLDCDLALPVMLAPDISRPARLPLVPLALITFWVIWLEPALLNNTTP